MRQAARVTRSLTYPRRGLHGEVVHLIGLQIMSGELKPGDPLPPEDELTSNLAVSRTVLREAVRVLAAKGLVDARPKVGTRVRARADWNILDPDVLSWRAEASNDSRLYEETTEVRLAIEPLAARLAATRATEDETSGIAEAYAAMEDGVDDQVAYLAADLRFHDRILAASPQRAPRPPRSRPARRASDDVRAHDDAEAVAPPGAPPAQGDPRQHRRGRRGGGRDGDAHADRRHRSRHPAHRPPGWTSPRLDLERLEARGNDDMEPRSCGVDDGPGATVFPEKPSQW